MKLKELIENHPVLIVLGMLTAGFVAGITVVGTILQITQLRVVPAHLQIAGEDQVVVDKKTYTNLEATAAENEGRNLIVFSVLYSDAKMTGNAAAQNIAKNQFIDLYNRMKAANKVEQYRSSIAFTENRVMLQLKDYGSPGNSVLFSAPPELLP